MIVERFITDAGTISVESGSSTVTGSGTTFGSRDREAASILATPAGQPPILVGYVAAVDPRGVYDNLELPLVNTYHGTTLSDVPYVLVDGPAIANGVTQAALYARFAAHLEQNMGLVGDLADTVDFALVPNNSIFWDGNTGSFWQWRNGVLDKLTTPGMETAHAAASPGTTISTTETQIASVAVNVPTSDAKVLLLGRADVTKDSGTTRRTATMRIRRGTENSDPQVGQDAERISPALASAQYGPLVVLAEDEPGEAGEITYTLRAEVSSSNASTVSRYELTAIVLAGAGEGTALSAQTFDISRDAGASITAFRIVAQRADGKVYHASVAEPDDEERVIGIALNSASVDEEVTVRLFGFITNVSWNFDPGVALWLGYDGVLTQTEPLAPDFGLWIGVALADDTILVRIDARVLQTLEDLHDVSLSSPQDGDALVFINDDWVNKSRKIVLSFPLVGKPRSEEVLLRFQPPVGEVYVFPAAFVASIASFDEVANEEAVFKIFKNEVEVGTVTVPASGVSGVFAADNPVTIEGNNNDILKLIAPESVDATLADGSFSIIGRATA